MLATVMITPPWPAEPYHLACPHATSHELCSRLGNSTAALASDCAEPEPETVEVLTSSLLGCRSRDCLYVDIGCNLGYLAAAAAALGADVDCYEPAPYFVHAMKETIRLNGFGRVNVTQAAVYHPMIGRAQASNSPRVANGFVDVVGETYTPCGIGVEERRQLGGSNGNSFRFNAPAREIVGILAGRTITLLKIDIDSMDGALLQAVVWLLRCCMGGWAYMGLHI